MKGQSLLEIYRKENSGGDKLEEEVKKEGKTKKKKEYSLLLLR